MVKNYTLRYYYDDFEVRYIGSGPFSYLYLQEVINNFVKPEYIELEELDLSNMAGKHINGKVTEKITLTGKITDENSIKIIVLPGQEINLDYIRLWSEEEDFKTKIIYPQG